MSVHHITSFNIVCNTWTFRLVTDTFLILFNVFFFHKMWIGNNEISILHIPLMISDFDHFHSLLPLPWASGLPVAIQCAWNLDPSVHWNATGEMPVCFQWSSSGFPVVFQCVPIMQINTGSPLGYHWVQASASVVPVASQCISGSSGLPVCSNYAN